MSRRKRFLLLFGSFLLMTTFVFTCNFTHVPTASASYAESCPPSQSEGNNNSWVQAIQFRLNGLDQNSEFSFPQFPLATDGVFGASTKDVVDRYQKFFMGITNGGDVVGDRTWASLGFCTGFPAQVPSGYTYGGSHCPGSLSNGASGTWVQALQQMLNIDGFENWISRGTWWPLTVDGGFGLHTENAVKSLQAANHLTQDGTVGGKTWGAMGICYT